LTCPIFFLYAEDGIRDRNVTGVQTCALPIYRGGPLSRPVRLRARARRGVLRTVASHLPRRALPDPRRAGAARHREQSAHDPRTRDRKSVVSGNEVELGYGRGGESKGEENRIK